MKTNTTKSTKHLSPTVRRYPGNGPAFHRTCALIGAVYDAMPPLRGPNDPMVAVHVALSALAEHAILAALVVDEHGAARLKPRGRKAK